MAKVGTRKRGKTWSYRYRLRTGKGKYKIIERGGYRTQAEALAAGEEAEGRARVMRVAWEPRVMSYSDLLEEWLTASRTQYKRATIDGHRKEVRANIRPALGNRLIAEIDPKTLQSFLDDMAGRHYTRNRLDRIRATLHQSMQYAVDLQYIASNPADKIKLPAPRVERTAGVRPPRPQRSVLAAVIGAIFERFPEGHPSHIPLLLGYRCGMRLGECFGITFNDIDYEAGTLTIRRQLQQDGQGLYITEPKYNSVRTIDLDIETLDVLRRQQEKINTMRVAFSTIGVRYPVYYADDAGKVSETPSRDRLDFVNVRLADGTLIRPSTLRHVARVVHGFEGDFSPVDKLWDFHAMRHTHASELLAAGLPTTYIQERLGHKRLETTLRTYTHITETDRDKGREMIRELY